MNFAYVLSSEFKSQLYLSLRSLFDSGTSVDKVIILSVGESIKWNTGGLPIYFEEVEDIGEYYWMHNKLHICNLNFDNFLFLDTDVIVRESLDHLMENGFDVTARRSTAHTLSSWDEKDWKRYLLENGAVTEMPVLNAGLLGFRNGIHRHIRGDWKTYMQEAWERRLFGNGYHADQWALPVALGRHGATCSLLDAEDHAFAWEGDSPEGATVYHTGASNFFGCVRKLKNPSFLEVDLPIPRPNVTWHYVQDRLKRKWESMWGATSKIAE